MKLRVNWRLDTPPPGGHPAYGSGTVQPEIPAWLLAELHRPDSGWRVELAEDQSADSLLGREVYLLTANGEALYTHDPARLPADAAVTRGHYSDVFSLPGEARELGSGFHLQDQAEGSRKRRMAALAARRVRVQAGRMAGQVELVVSDEGEPLLQLYLFADLIGSARLAETLTSFAQASRKGEFLSVYDLFERDQDLADRYRVSGAVQLVEGLLRAGTRAELIRRAWSVTGPSSGAARVPAPPQVVGEPDLPQPGPEPVVPSPEAAPGWPTPGLTEDQQFISEYPGSVAIDAGAGSGKTFVLVRRLLHLIRQGLRPEELVAVTFTEPAAAELRGRLQALLSTEADAQPALRSAAQQVPLAQISTIHALCARIVRDHPLESGAGLRFQVLDESQASVWLDAALQRVLGALPEAAFGALPAGLAVEALRLMLADPHRAEGALKVGLATYASDLAALEEARTRTAELAEGTWISALRTLAAVSGPDPADPLEMARCAALQAGTVTGSWPTRHAAMRATVNIRSNAGSGKTWGAANKQVVTSAISALRDLCAPDDALDAAIWQLQAGPVLQGLYHRVQADLDRLKVEQEVLTFPDLERLAARALEHPEVRAYYHGRWRAVCVDEFQDTSPLQWQILSALVSAGVNLTVVGDEKQSIYAFRGADVRLFQQARSQIASQGGANRALSTSFRTHAGLVDVTNAFFGAFMPGPVNAGSTAATFRPLQAHRSVAPHPSLPCEFHVVNGAPKVNVAALRTSEADLIAHRVQALMAEGRTVLEGGLPRPLQYRDVAVLLRVRTNLALYEGALFRAGIPYTVQGGRGLLDRPEVRDLTQLLLFLALPADDLALAAVLRSPLFGWTDQELLRLTTERPSGETLWQALRRSATPAPLLAELLAARAGLTASALISRALEHTPHAAVMASLPDGARRLANIDAFLSLLHGWAAQGQADVQSAAGRLGDTVRLELPVAEASLGSEDALQIMTIHGSKGLEFPVVIVPDLLQPGGNDRAPLLMDAQHGLALRVPGVPGERQPAPHLRLQDLLTERRASEAERLMYVAMTRAADTLILTATAKSTQAGEISRLATCLPQQNVSRFAYDHLRISRPEPQRLQRGGHVHGARKIVEAALPDTLPVTSIGVYLNCPKSFEYRYLTGRPPFTPLWQAGGAGATGGASGAAIGSAVHQAIELGWSGVRIQSGFAHLRAEERAEVANLVQSLQTPAFAALPAGQPRREVPLSVPFGELTFEGVIDALYTDTPEGAWIVDYKTDRTVRPEHHAPQLALYMQATGAQRASLAYLRHGLVHTLSEAELHQGLSLSRRAAGGIQAGQFAPTPSAEACRFCLHRQVCDSAVTFEQS